MMELQGTERNVL